MIFHIIWLWYLYHSKKQSHFTIQSIQCEICAVRIGYWIDCSIEFCKIAFNIFVKYNKRMNREQFFNFIAQLRMSLPLGIVHPCPHPFEHPVEIPCTYVPLTRWWATCICESFKQENCYVPYIAPHAIFWYLSKNVLMLSMLIKDIDTINLIILKRISTNWSYAHE